MAASLSRPDPSSPASVAEAGFSTTRRGFHQDEVRAFLTSVAAELGRLQERGRQLEAELRELRDQAPAAVELDDETVANLLGEETLRVLHTARESASEIKIRAEETAARILRDANEEANRLRQDAEVDAARRRQDAGSDAEAEVALAKQQGREMVNEARAYRERVLADLERRTTLARHQIEELAHGRDRLLQVFERARLVAVDVTSELQSIDGPDELVNLAPTTGPVPLMVKRPRPEPAATPDPDDDHATPSGPVGADSDQRESEIAETTETDADAEGDADADAEGDPDDHVDVAAPDVVDDADTEDTDTGDADADADADAGDADADADADAGDADTDDTDGDGESVGSARDADANVVSLFRGRVTSHDDDDADAGHDTTDESAGARTDVGGIFERLRSEVPAESTIDDTIDDTIESGTGPPTTDADEPVEATPFTRRDEALVPLIVASARKLKRVLADEQNGVLDTLRRNEPVTSIDDLLPQPHDHVRHYVDTVADELVGAAATGAAELGASDTKTLRRKLAKAGALEAAHGLIASDLVGPLRERLGRAVADGAGDNDDITKRVRAVYREWKTQRIDDQLDDVLRFAHGGGIATSVEPGVAMIWSIDPDQPACPDCEDNSLAGSVAAGEAYPTGHTAAPAHPGCRCLTVPTAG